MDPISFALGLMVLMGAFKVGVKATADGYATMKAAGSGRFDFIDADRQRKADTRQKLAAAWAERRKLRAEQAGDTDGAYRPGAKEYASDLYHGFWEDRLDRRSKKRAGRPEWQYDPDAKPWHIRFDEAVIAKGRELRGSRAAKAATDAARRFVAPVGEKPPPAADRAAVNMPDRSADPDAVAVGDLPVFVAEDPADCVPVGCGDDGAPYRCPACGSTLNLPAVWCQECEVRVAMRGGKPAPIDPAPTTVPDSPDVTPIRIDSPEEPMTAPTSTNAAAVAGEVNNNEDARRVFEAQIKAAAEASDALAAYEVAQQRLGLAATSGLDGLNAKRFDKLAQAAQANAADLLPSSDMSQAAQAIEGIRASAEQGLAAFDKYRDSEQLVNDNNVDGKTLETADSV